MANKNNQDAVCTRTGVSLEPAAVRQVEIQHTPRFEGADELMRRYGNDQFEVQGDGWNASLGWIWGKDVGSGSRDSVRQPERERALAELLAVAPATAAERDRLQGEKDALLTVLHDLLKDYEALRRDYREERGLRNDFGDMPDKSALMANGLLVVAGRTAVALHQSPSMSTAQLRKRVLGVEVPEPRSVSKPALIKAMATAHEALLNVPFVGEVYDEQHAQVNASAKALLADTAAQVGESEFPLLPQRKELLNRRFWPGLLEAMAAAYVALDDAPRAGMRYEQFHSDAMTHAALQIEEAARAVGMRDSIGNGLGLENETEERGQGR